MTAIKQGGGKGHTVEEMEDNSKEKEIWPPLPLSTITEVQLLEFESVLKIWMLISALGFCFAS